MSTFFSGRVRMSVVLRSGCALLRGGFLLLAAAGCSVGPSNYWPYWPFEPPDRTTYQTPAKRIARLSALAADASQVEAAEQVQILAELVEEYHAEEDPLVRAQVLRTAAAFQSEVVDELLREGLTDASGKVRIDCCEILGKRGDAEAIATLARVLDQDKDIDVQLAAVRALAHFRDAAAVEALATALDSPDPALQYRAIQSLRTMTGKDFGNDTSRWREYVRSGPPAPPAAPSLADRLRRLF
ncbi:MAG: hypothetical protein BMS9Abin04_072 [Planctomycetia bacterium]|nr:MAG: hypothetical protein BMS9Abin04_072 [Planctomycetia bacterium]